MNLVYIKPGNIFLTRDKGFLAKAIQICTRTIGEKRTLVNHVGVVVEEGTLQTCIVVEALTKVRRHKLWNQYGPDSRSLVAIYRPTNLTATELDIIVKYANDQVGRKYGYFKILAHLLDWFFLGIYFFRRFFKNNKYPICSWLVAYAYSEADKDFGVEAGAAQPDDIWDFVRKNPDKYKEIYPLKSIWNNGNSN